MDMAYRREGTTKLVLGTIPAPAGDRRLETPAPPGFMHVGVLQNIRSVIEELGQDPNRVLVEAGVDPRVFGDAQNLLPFTTVGDIISSATEQTGCPHLGLLVGSRATLKSLRLVGYLMEFAPTLGKALDALQRHLGFQNRGAVVRLHAQDGEAVLSYSPYHPGARGAALQSDGGVAVAVKIIRELVGEAWAPTEILLPRAKPLDVEPYRRIFRAPIRFNQEIAALVFPAADLAIPIRTADPAKFRQGDEALKRLSAGAPHSFTDELRRVLRTEIMRNRCPAADVSRTLGMHRRTLNRRLHLEDRSYKDVLDEMRFEVARQLLGETTISLGQMSAALDFSEPAAFTRAFRRWSGQTPSAWRAAHRGPREAVLPG